LADLALVLRVCRKPGASLLGFRKPGANLWCCAEFEELTWFQTG